MQALLRKSLIISGLGLGAAVLGAIGAVPARSFMSPGTASGAVRAEHGATNEPSAYYYFPSQFEAPEGPVAEPIATF